VWFASWQPRVFIHRSIIIGILKMLSRLKTTYRRFPRDFWVLMLASFVDMLGGSLIFPFFALFITQKFNVGMTQVGTMFLVWSLTSSVIGNTLGGAMADKFGRKTNLIIGLVASAVSALLMLLIGNFNWFFLAVGVVGIFQDIAGPARHAMIADLVPEDLRSDAFGMFRIVFNLSATIGPLIGGLVASRSFNALFIADVVISILVAVFVFLRLPETKPVVEKRMNSSMRVLWQTPSRVTARCSGTGCSSPSVSSPCCRRWSTSR